MKMKLQIAAFMGSLFMLGINNVQAQEDDAVNFGIKGGLNYSWLNLSDAEDETGLIGFHAGIMTRINITSSFALQGEALYSEKGTRVEYENAFFEGEAKLRINYIDVPLMVVLKLNENINIQAGPYLSFLIDARAVNDASDNDFDFEEEVDNDFFNDTDYGLTAGIGFELNRLHSGIRYYHGLQEIEEEKEINGVNYEFTDAQNSMIQLFLAFVF
jgi:Outer membrane protein beta-barrel domain